MSSQKIEFSHFSPDTSEFIALPAQYKVRYVIVGGEAVIFHRIDGVSFREAWETRHTIEMETESRGAGVPVHFLSLPNLLKNKETAGRPKDLDDLRYLRRATQRSDQ